MHNNIKYLLYFLNNKFAILFFFIFILFYRNSYSNLFNGVPFSNKYETLFILVILPIILLFNSKIFIDKKFKYLIYFILIIKIFLNSTEFTNGLKHKIYKNTENNTDIIESYSSYWFKNISDVQNQNWSIKKKFPLDWMNYDKSFNIPGGKTVASTEKYKKYKLADKVETYLIVNQEKKINFFFEGLVNDSYLEIYNKEKNLKKKIIINNGENKIFFDRGKYRLKFNLTFSGEKWAFNIYPSKNNFELSNFKFLSINESKLDLNLIVFFIYLGLFYEILLICLIIYLLYFSIKKIIYLKNLFLFLVHPICLFLSFYILNYFNIDDQTYFWTLSLSFIFLFFCYFFNLKLILNNNEANFIFLSMFLTTTLYCAFIFSPNLETTFFWTAGDDWMIFHEYARKIVIDKEWIRAGEDVYYYRPGIRYVFAFFHLIFGNSSFAIQFIDVWSILISSYLIFLILLKNNINIRVSLSFAIIFPIIIFGESFRWLIGRGLTEFFGTFIILLTSFLIYKKKLKFNMSLLGICFLIIITAWLREEKFLASISVILLTTNFAIKQNFFIDIFYFIINNYKLIFIYSLLILIGFPLLFILRNYIYSENITALDNPVFLKFGYKSLYTIIMGVSYNDYPRLIGLINIPGVIISILIIFSYKFYRYINNVGIPIIILMLILPTLIFEIPGYIPRHSIYLVPYTLLLNTIFINKIYNSFHKNN